MVAQQNQTKQKCLEWLETECLCPPKIHTCNMISSVMILGGGAFRSDKVIRVESSRMGLEPSQKPHRAALTPPPHENTERRPPSMNYEPSPDTLPAGTSILDVPAARAVRNQFLLSISPPEWTKTRLRHLRARQS